MQQQYLWRLGLALVTALVLIVTGTQGNWETASTPLPVQGQMVDPHAISPTNLILAQTPPEIPPETLPATTYALTDEDYADPANRFQVGILEAYQVSAVGNFPLFESPDGNLAYTVVAKPIIPSQTLTQAELAAVAIDTFANGEGFTPQRLQPVSQEGVVIPWTGSLTQGRSSQPISGTILARQTANQVLLLLVSATAAQADQVDAVLATLIDTLQPM